ncbi:MAG TPA: hypothetical protein VFB12_08145 [Ktedonobacteraceae bacterium]|nr:hypothetical protein [Ktedonobacteraceae bacterium]
MNTGEVVELFDGGWLNLDEGLPCARVIGTRYLAPADKLVKVGKRGEEWVIRPLHYNPGCSWVPCRGCA